MLNLGLTLYRSISISSSNVIVLMISAAKNHSLCITNVAYSWGIGTYGELGAGSTYTACSPVPVCGASYDVTITSAISAGGSHSLGIDDAGIAYAWGRNNNGQLGNPGPWAIDFPVQVCGDLIFTAISAGDSHSLGITDTGAAYAWGSNVNGQLGDNSTVLSRNTPVQVCGGLTFTAISAGYRHSLGITDAGEAYAWGANNVGQLGNNIGTGTSNTPVQVCGGLTFTAIAAGGNHSLGITSSGVAYAWGRNNFGQLGDDSSAFTVRSTPVQVCGGLTFTAISAGDTHSLGITDTGAVYAWGSNINGQLGDSSQFGKSIPVAVCGGGLTFVAISAGTNYSLGITDTGLAYGWGYNYNDQLGLGTSMNKPQKVPKQVNSTFLFSSISARGLTLAISTDGILYAWGAGSSGQLGNSISGTNYLSDLPVQVCGGLTFTAISAGTTHSLGITDTGVAYAWGSGSSGRLGNGFALSMTTPVQVCGDLTFTAISAGESHSLGITSSGVAYAWGANGNGRLGNNSTVSRDTPVQVCGGLTFTSISAGYSHSLGITDTGVAYAWGLNSSGQLGDNSTVSRTTPVQVYGGLTFTSISAGNSHSLGITDTGVAYAWGANNVGQLGNNIGIGISNTPVQVCGGLTFTAISAGINYSVGIDIWGVAYAWGSTSSGQLGFGLINIKTPTKITII